MKKILSLALVLQVIALVACSPEHEVAKKRASISKAPVLKEKPQAKVQNSLEDQNASASARVAELAQETSRLNRFRFLHAFENRKEKLVGRVEVSANPFIQLLLSSEMLKRDDLKTFIAQVEKAREQGEVSDLQWSAFWIAKKAYDTTGSTWGLIKFQTKAMNQKIAATFPGVLGGVNELEKSLPYNLIRKFDGGLNPSNSEVQKILAASLPVLLNGFDVDMQKSLAAAIHNYPLNPGLADSERASSFVLWQRLFAQLLLLKGHSYAKFQTVDGNSSLPLLTDEHNSFVSGVRTGYFLDPQTGKAVALTSADIGTYDPAKRILLLTGDGKTLANLAHELAIMRGTSLAFEASSPAAYFVKGPSGYLFGDIQGSNRAIVPAEAHSLSFGLTVMQLKNIAARRIAEINKDGKDIRIVGGEAQGMVLFDDVNGQKQTQLASVLKLIEINIQLDSAISDIVAKSEKNSEELQAMNSLYASKDIIGSMRLLQEKLKTMRYPLFMLTMRLVNSDQEMLVWNPSKGFESVGQKLTLQSKQRAGVVLRELGNFMNQPLIQQQADELLGEQEIEL